MDPGPKSMPIYYRSVLWFLNALLSLNKSAVYLLDNVFCSEGTLSFYYSQLVSQIIRATYVHRRNAIVFSNIVYTKNISLAKKKTL